jgi:hypothetical protein
MQVQLQVKKSLKRVQCDCSGFPYVVDDFGMHERLDHGQDFVEEVNDVHHMDGAEFARNSLLKVRKEFLDGAEIDSCQMHQTDVLHVKQENSAVAWTLLL